MRLRLLVDVEVDDELRMTLARLLEVQPTASMVLLDPECRIQPHPDNWEGDVRLNGRFMGASVRHE